MTKQAAFTIETRELTATWNSLDMVYNGAAQAPRIAGLIGVLEADAGKVQASADDSAQTAAGSYSALARLTGERAHNYTLRNDTASFAIRPAPVVFQVEMSSAPYDGQPHTAQITAQALGQVFEDFTIQYQSADGQQTAQPVEAGRYPILATITDANYRHSDGADQAARQIGVLEIYSAAAPAAYSVTFLPGAADATGSAPTLPASLAGGVQILPGPGELERPGYRFAGWQYGGRVYSAGSTFVMPAENVQFTAVWDETTYSIDGSVVWEPQEGESAPRPAGDVLITLMRGNEQIAQTQTDLEGRFSFQQVSAGLYNLVASYGEIMQTQKVELIDRDQNQCVIQLPEGNTNSVLKVLDGAPPVVVGNLDNVFAQQPDEVYTEEDRTLVKSGGTVEIRMTVEQERPTADSPLQDALNKLVEGFREGLTLDLTLDKTRKDADGAALDERPVTESNLLIEIVIQLNGELQNRHDYRVLREHEGAVDEIGTEANQRGEYFVVNDSRTILTIFAKQFSLYSVVYANAQPVPEDQTAQNRPVEQAPAVIPIEPAVTKPAVEQEKETQPAVLAPETEPLPSEPDARPQPDARPPEESEPEQPEPEQPEPVETQADGKPFVVLNAAAALLGILLAVFATSRGKERILSAVFAVCALAVTLLTSGWNGLALANGWTIPVMLLALLAARFSRGPREPVNSDTE